MKKINHILLGISLIIFLTVPAIFTRGLVNAQAPAPTTPAPTTTAPPANSKDALCQGLDITGSGNSCDQAASNTAAESLVGNVIAILSWVVGIAAVIMIIVGGIKYILSQGDSGSVNSAKNTILYAVIGLVVAMFAQLIVRFVINRV